jgi:oxygen-independent coproporphyrinogen-3 oxidase
MRPEFLKHARRDLPRYTSYPTAVRFGPEVGVAEAEAWAGAVPAGAPISVYAHTPFCDQLCWYCGCHTTVPNGYDRVARFVDRLEREADLWAVRLGPHGGAAHLHFGGGSPNSLSPADFERLAARLRRVFRVRPDAEVAVELDPRSLDAGFVEALGRSGVTRASLGVQTFDPEVQARVNRIQPFAQVAEAVRGLRAAGVGGINFDLMYGLPLQTPERVAESARLAAELRPDRLAVFGYAHVPWFKKHQKMIREDELADLEGRWAQAEAADTVLTRAGYVRIGLDHYALPDDPLVEAAGQGRLRRNFQGYTTDTAEVLVPLGPSAIGAFPDGFVQNARASDAWARVVDAGVLAVDRGLVLTDEDRRRAAVIERVMCDLAADFDPGMEGVRPVLEALAADGLCALAEGRVTVAPEARRLVRVVAAAFDAGLAETAGRHARAV